MATRNQLSPTVSSLESFFVEILSSLDNIFKLPSRILISDPIQQPIGVTLWDPPLKSHLKKYTYYLL
ncbi:hypothetical protein [Methanobacterium oryzae]|uniref:hypothetical protein n=1 Tax=Methanobacterium oryzae TaxID=69540 RepID=UPI003D1C9232